MLFTHNSSHLRETSQDESPRESLQSRNQSVCIQTVCDKEIQASFEEEADLNHPYENSMPEIYVESQKAFGKHTQFTQSSYESEEFEPEPARSLIFEPKPSRAVNEINSLKQDLSALSQSIKTLQQSKTVSSMKTHAKSPPQASKHVNFRNQTANDHSFHNPMLFESVQEDSRILSVLERAAASSKRAQRFINPVYNEETEVNEASKPTSKPVVTTSQILGLDEPKASKSPHILKSEKDTKKFEINELTNSKFKQS